MAETLPDLVLSPREKKTITLDSDTLFQNKNIRSGITIDGDVFGEGEIVLVPAGSVEVENYGWTHAFVSMTSVVSVPAVPVTGLTLATSTPIIIGTVNNPKLPVTVAPVGATGYTIAYTSSDPTKIAFNANGTFNVLTTGAITATAVATNKDTTTVTSNTVTLTPVAQTGSITAIPVQTSGSTYTVVKTFTPTTPEGETTWTYASSDPTVATFTNGIVTTIKEGQTTLTVTRKFRGSSVSATTVLTVYDQINATAVTPVASSPILVGTTNNPALTYSVTPANATGYTVAWSSTATDKITFNANGSFNIVGTAGSIPVTCTVTNKDGSKVTGSVTLTSVVATGTADDIPTLAPNATYQTVYSFIPATPVGETSYVFNSTASAIASISNTGLITAHAEGTTTITIARQFRGSTTIITKSVSVVAVPVAVPMTDVYLNSIPRAIVGTVNNPAVEYTFEPSNASGYTVAYTAEGAADVVTVHSDGKFDVLQDLGGAYIRITVTNADGSTCTDRSGVQTTTLDVSTASTSAINVGQTYQLVYTVDPTPDSDAVYEFTTTDPTVATIDSNGLATGTGDGFCRIGLTVHYRGMSSSDSSGFTVNAV